MDRRLPALAWCCAALCFSGVSLLRADELDEGRGLFAERRYAEAAQRLRAFCEQKPNDRRVVDAQILLAESLIGAGLTLEAVETYEKLVRAIRGRAKEREVRQRLAQCYEAKGDFAKALVQYKEYLTRFPTAQNGRETQLRVARLHESFLNQPREAIAAYEAAAEREPDHAGNVAIYKHIADLRYQKMRDTAGAIKAYRSLVEKLADKEGARAAQAQIAYLCEDGGLRDYPLAITEYQKYVESFPKAPDLLAKLERIATLYRDRLSQYHNAADTYAKALKLAPSARLLWEKAKAAARTGDQKLAEAAHQEVITKHPKTKEGMAAFQSLWRMQWEQGKTDVALKTFAALLSHHGGRPADRCELAQRYVEAKQLDKAIAEYQKIVKASPAWSNGEAVIRLSQTYLEKGDAASAEKTLLAVMKAHPKESGLTARALWALATGVYKGREEARGKAIEAYVRLLTEYPKHELAGSNRAGKQLVACYAAAGDPAGLEKQLQALAGRLPLSGTVRRCRAELVGLYNGAKQHDKAIKCAEQVIAEGSSDAAGCAAHLALAEAYGALGRVEEQLRVCTELARHRTLPELRSLHARIDKACSVANRVLFDVANETVPLTDWSSKKDPERKGEDYQAYEDYTKDKAAPWFAGKLDQSWQKVKMGEGGAKYEGAAWYVTTSTSTGLQGNYSLGFSKVKGEAWVYVDGMVKKQHRGRGPFTATFQLDKNEGAPFVIVVWARGKANGGAIGPCVLTKPKQPSEKERWLCALANHALGKFGEAAKEYEKRLAEVKEGPARLPVVRLMRSLVAAQGDVEKFHSLPVAEPTLNDLHLAASTYAKGKKQEKAIAVLEEARRKFPKSLQAHRRLARTYEKQRQYGKAVDAYLAVITQFGEAASQLGLKRHVVELAYSAAYWRNTPRARELAEQFHKEEPSLHWERLLGDLYFDRQPQDYAKALTHYQACLKAAAESDEKFLTFRVFDCLANLKKYDEAASLGSQWTAKPDREPSAALDMQYRVAEAHRQSGQLEKALKAYEQILERAPQSGAALYGVLSVVNNAPAAPKDTALDQDPRHKLVRRWESLNPGDTRAAEMYLQLGAKMQQEEGGAENARALYSLIWQKYRQKWPESIDAASRLLGVLQAKDPEAALALCEEITRAYGGNRDRRVVAAWDALMSRYTTKVKLAAKADSTLKGYGEGTLADGNRDGRSGNRRSSWVSAETPVEHWVECTFAKKEKVTRVAVYWASRDWLPRGYKIQHWDGANYVDFPETVDWQVADSTASVHAVKEVETDRVRILQDKEGGSEKRKNAMAMAEVEVYRTLDEERLVKLIELSKRMANAYGSQAMGLRARRMLADFYLEKAEFVESLMELQRMVRSAPRNYGMAIEAAQARIGRKRFGEAVVLLRALLDLNPNMPQASATEVERLMAQALGQSGMATVSIDPSLPEAGLLWGDIFARAGETKLAYEKFLASRDLFEKHQHQLSPKYIRLIIGRLLVNDEVKDAIEVSRRFIIRRGRDKNVSAADKAAVQVLVGDCYFKDERYDIAIDEYRTAAAMYPGTKEAVDAQFRVGEALMAQKIFDKAGETFTELAKSNHEETAMRAELMLGILFHAEGDKQRAQEQFKKVLALTPKDETADTIIFRLGQVYQEEGKYKEALDTLRLIGAWGGERKEYLQPGTELRIRVSDRDLNLTKGSPEIPVLVQTTAGDEERVVLRKSEAGEGLFVGAIKTILGTPVKQDKLLQVNGKDEITYGYDPEFAQDYVILTGTQSYAIRVAADAELEASATEIKDEDEEEEEPLAGALRERAEGRRSFRDASQIKPGNNVYVRVLDADRDWTDDPDAVKVEVTATSGDSLVVGLEEREEHCGKFYGAIKTGERPPDALASDSAEGHEPLYAVDGADTADKCWMAARDSRVPKWIVVDLKDVYAVQKIEWTRGTGFKEGDDRRPLRYTLEASKDKRTWRPIAMYPGKSAPLQGAKVLWNPDGMQGEMYTAAKMLEGNGDVKSHWAGTELAKDWVLDLDLGSEMYLEKTVLMNHDDANEVRRYTIYVERDLGVYPGNNRETTGWEQLYETSAFSQPKTHSLRYTGLKRKARFMRIHITDKFGDRPEIGEFEIYPKVWFRVEEAKEGVGATISLGYLSTKTGTFRGYPVEARYVRMMIHEYRGDAPAIAKFGVWDKDDKQIVPSGVDVHELATNDVLEISSGDEITVAYVDDINIDPGLPRTLRQMLTCTYYDGSAVALRRVFEEDDRGNRVGTDHTLFRLDAGERFIVQIEEFDEDQTDGIDEVEFRVKTSGGELLAMKARETEPYSGIFVKEVDTTPTKRPDALLLKDGESIELAYWDSVNTYPGNRTERTYTLFENVPTAGTVKILSSIEAEAESESESEVKEDEETALLALAKPLVVEIYDPDAARHSGDVVTVELSTSGGDTAEVTCEYAGDEQQASRPRGRGRGRGGRQGPPGAELTRPGQGKFRGEIKLVLGDKDSPDEMVEIASAFAEDMGMRAAKDAATTPVLNVCGTDIITAVYLDEQSPDGEKTERTAHARVVCDGEVGIYDDEYEDEVGAVHLGDSIYVQVTDGDADTTGERDKVTIALKSTLGDVLKIELEETLTHSGVFNRAIPVGRGTKPEPANDVFEADFGDELTATYVDPRHTGGGPPLELTATTSVVAGTDAQLTAFGRLYPDEGIAIQTELRIGECYFQLGKEHLDLKNEELGLAELDEGKKVLAEVVARYPESEMRDQVTFLMGQFAEEMKTYLDAARIFRVVTDDFPESSLAPEAQLRIAICLEKEGDFGRACEEYVRLAYKFPGHSLIADSMIRIGLHFFNEKDYDTALSVLNQFVTRYPEHIQAEKVSFKAGLCYILSERFSEGADHFKQFVDKFGGSSLKPAALYWAGDAFLKANDALSAYQMFKRVIWDFPDSKWAKYARGRLTAPVFDRIAEDE